MPLKYITLLILHITLICNINGGDSLAVEVVKSDSSFWKTQTEIGLFGSQSAYSNYWKEGGINSVAVNTRVEFNANYKKNKLNWENRVEGRLGLTKQGEYEFIKNEDLFEIDSKYGHQYNKYWRFSGLLNFKTNFYDTYKVQKTGERGKIIGDFLSPAYLNIGSGIDLVGKEKVWNLYYSPINSKISYVKNDSLRAQFLPKENVNSGTRYELGSLFRMVFQKEIMKNVTMRTIGTFFTNHLENFGNFDVNIESRFNFKINKFLSANFLTRLIYDEDLIFDIKGDDGEPNGRKGPRTQFNEVFNLGISQKF